MEEKEVSDIDKAALSVIERMYNDESEWWRKNSLLFPETETLEFQEELERNITRITA